MLPANHYLFPIIEPYEHGMLRVDDIHTIYWEQCGNPHGIPVIFLHGGPGAGASPDHRRFFDPSAYRIVIFDQRGAGRSTPFAELQNNSPEHLIADIEKLRIHLNIDKWLIFGGSWGSTLGIAYGEAYPASCLAFILRGIFLMRKQEIEWFLYGIRHFYPKEWEKFCHYIPADERHDLLSAYYRRLTNPDPNVHLPAAKIFSQTEACISSLLPKQEIGMQPFDEKVALSLARIETSYFINYGKTLGRSLLSNIQTISHLPAIIIQGRYDMCCPPVSAYELAQMWPKAELQIIPDAGHASSEPGIVSALVAATEKFKNIIYV